MTSSLADSTIKQYNITFKLWWSFCNNKGIPFYQGDVSHVISFFQELLESTTNIYGSFNSHRAALSLILPGNIGSDTHLHRFLKGIARIRPPRPKYDHIWDPQQVLSYFENISDQENLKFLSEKLVTLLTLATGHRLQTISLIKCSNIKISQSAVTIFIPDIIKTSGPNKKQPCLELPFFEKKPKLCVASLIIKYLEVTRSTRSSECDWLFLTYNKPHGPASKQTLSRWVKNSLKTAGVDVSIFTAHSTRHASTSAALRKGLSVDTIRKTAGWSENSSVFAVFYNRPLNEKGDYLRTVFDS